MAAPNLTIEIVKNECVGILLKDTTSDYGTGDVVSAGDVSEVKIDVTYNASATTVNYVFTLVNAAITAATIAINSGTTTSILSEITNTTWPFSGTNTFDLCADYGVVIPTFSDDVYTVEYTISGTYDGDDFEYSTTRSKLVACDKRCCLDTKWMNLDLSCACSADGMKQLVYGESLYYVAELASEEGSIAKAQNALNELEQLCDNDCGC